MRMRVKLLYVAPCVTLRVSQAIAGLPPRGVTAVGGRRPQEEAREGTDEGDAGSLSCQYVPIES